ncbi:hypothetical protein IJ162_01585 [Candidatus Saccharibacteria bacterium]|nr:hypothetical protein [Candidatus Saccharibacteria bacterium]
MKKTLIAGAASLALAATPVFGVFAATPAAVVDTLTVTVAVSCTFARTAGQATYAKTMQANKLDAEFGSSTFTSHCNNGTGYTITPTFTSLTFTGAAQPITYSTSTPTAGSGTWTAKLSGASESLASGTAFGSQTSQDPAAGRAVTILYTVSTKNNQAKGTYTGTAKYQLSMNS